ncbi:unnamed protein product [Pipistrellus nathusii]|uniref:Uncharacterized protein n=1 Tax=Pipistrellus nathusii TaxID=59473 RepID=A0ABN9ZSJ8_PIPNA
MSSPAMYRLFLKFMKCSQEPVPALTVSLYYLTLLSHSFLCCSSSSPKHTLSAVLIGPCFFLALVPPFYRDMESGKQAEGELLNFPYMLMYLLSFMSCRTFYIDSNTVGHF